MADTDSKPKSRFELVVELIKALAWPCIVLIFLAVLWTPINQTASLLPSIISRSDTITIAGLSLRVGQGLKSKATPQVERVLSQISSAGIERLLEMGEASYWDRSSIAHGHSRNDELVKLKLAMEIPVKELEEMNSSGNKDHGYGVRITELGKQTRSFLQSLIAEFIQQLPRQSPGK